MIAGVVLAGGRSSRLGSEKAMARIGATPLVAHAADVLANGCGVVAINAPPSGGAAGWARRMGLPLTPDRPGDPRGPLSGVLAAMDWAAAQGLELVAVAPCDCPRLPRDLVARLTGGLTDDAGAAVARTGEGLEPACAVWRVAGRDRVEVALAGGGHHPPLHEVLSAVNAREVAFEDAAAFADADTLAELRAMGGRPDSILLLLGRAAAGALRVAGLAALAAYGLGGLMLAALVATAGDPRPGEDLHALSALKSARFDMVLAGGMLWVGLIAWAGPRLLSPRPARRRPLDTVAPPLTKESGQRI